jgi:hypothetical protein
MDSKTKKQSSTTSRTLSNSTAAPITSKTKHATSSISTTTITTEILQRIPNHTVNSPVRRVRRLLNDLTYDTDLSSTNTSIDHVSDVDGFLTVNNEELSKQLLDMAMTVDGSGFCMYQ